LSAVVRDTPSTPSTWIVDPDVIAALMRAPMFMFVREMSPPVAWSTEES